MKAPLLLNCITYFHSKSNTFQLTCKIYHLIPFYPKKKAPISVCFTPLYLKHLTRKFTEYAQRTFTATQTKAATHSTELTMFSQVP